MLKQFLGSLMRPPHYMELRAIHLRRGVVGRLFTRDPAEVEKFALKYGRDAEIYMGVAPRRARSGTWADCEMPLAVWVDADNEPATRAELALFELEPSITVNSGGGLHLYWLLRDEPESTEQLTRALRQLASRLEGDLKSAEPAHILRIPGTMNHKYTPPRQVRVEHMDLDRRYTVGEILEATAAAVAEPVRSAAFLKGRAWMAELPPAVQGEHGDDATYRAACMLVRDLGLDTEDALELMMEWNEKCVPPWTAAELMKKIHGAEAYGKGEKGHADPETDFEGLGGGGDADFDVADDSRKDFDKLSEMFKVVDDDGTLRIFRRMRDESLGRDLWRRYKRGDFLDVCRSVLQLKPKLVHKKQIPVAEYWLDYYRGKHTFNGMTMRPDFVGECTPDGMLNMWNGFAFTPRPGEWALLKSMIFESVCRWDAVSYDYILNWMARAVQCPWEPAGTALVLRGKKGTGKGTLGRAFYRLFGQHGMHFASRDLLTGRFNAHLRDCVALFADEAFYAGDKVGESVLKAFITEPALVYEEKGKNPVMGRNYLHVIMASNLDWVVPAGMDNERRFAVFEVEDCGYDKRWWDRLYAELNTGGMEAMLYELLHRNIDDFDMRQVPQTAALAAQKAHAMDVMAAWLLDMAERGWKDFGESEENTFLVNDIYSSFLRYCDDRNIYQQRQNKIAFCISLRKYIAPKHLRVMKEGQQYYFYVLPDAEETLKSLRKTLGIGEEI